MQTIEHPDGRAIQDAGMAGALRGQATPGRARLRCSARTTSEVLNDWLGLDKDAIGGLKNNGVIG